MNTMLFAGGLLASWAVVCSAYAGPNSSDSVALSVKPSRCVALRQGQQCYQKLQFVWHSSGEDRICLYERDGKEALACWASTTPYKFSYRFNSAQNKTFLLKNERTQLTLSEVEVVVAWVYKSSKKVSTGWRLF